MNEIMNTVTIGVSTLEEFDQRLSAAFRGEPQGSRLSFVSMELLLKTFTPRRVELVQAMAGKGAMSLRAAARLVGRDVKTTHGDVHALLKSGVLEKTEDGKIEFPYDNVRIDFSFGATSKVAA